MEKTLHTFNLPNDKTVTMSFKDFSEEINLDRILVIDYSELVAETLTFPVILNKFGFLLADQQNALSSAKVDLEVYEAKKKQEFRNELVEKGLKFTINQIDEALILDKVWQVKKKNLITKQKKLDYINSVYWSAKEKITLLQKLSISITENEVRNLKTKEFNSVKITTHNRLIE